MERRLYVKKAFQMYQTNKTTLFWKEQEYKNIPVPGESAMNYDKISVQSSGNGVEAQFIKYAEDRAKLKNEIDTLKRKIELVHLTIKHFEIEGRAKGKRHYEYIQQRWLMRRSFRRAAIECGIAESTAIFWTEEIYTVAESIAELDELF
jgi:hypothetical protein